MNARNSYFCCLLPLLAINAQAQESETLTEESSSGEFVETVVVVGSRRQSRALDEMAVPVDVFENDLLQTHSEILDSLTSAIPSYNAGREPISDAATLMRPANLRGLSSDSTLVLVNGKRRHRGAVIGEFISGINKGAQGVDINPLAGIAVKRVEVLRDGASAQYGSDAIAGVLNFVLEDNPNINRWEVQYGSTFEGDGAQARLSGVFGLPLGVDGFLTLALDAKHSEPTVRSSQDPQATKLVEDGFKDVADPVVKWGSPEVKDNYKILVNGMMPVAVGEVYGFSNFGKRDVDGSFFFRNPNTRQNVFVVGTGVDAVRLVADVSGEGCPTVTVGDGRASHPGLQDLITNTNCFVFNEWFPGGFTPRFGGIVNDRSTTFGWRGDLPDEGYKFDFSLTFGRSQAIYEIHNTVNASYGPNSPTDFYLGEAIQAEQLLSLEWQTIVDVDRFSELNIAWGFQYHRENYQIVAGEDASWQRGRFYTAGFSVGSNGFQGYSNDVAGNFSRYNLGAYAEFEIDWTKDLLLSFASRWEDFSDFGDTLNGKFAFHYQVMPDVGLRGSLSTGFRAPTVGQSNLRRTSTGFSGGQLVEQVVLPPTNPVSALKGGRALEPETSINTTLGLTFTLGYVDISVDWFNVAVDRRIALTGLDLTEDDRASLLAAGVTGTETVSRVNFFVNDFDTNTSGLDVVASTDYLFNTGLLSLSVLANMTFTEVTSSLANSTLDAATAKEIEDALPDFRINSTATYIIGSWRTMARLNYFGSVYEHLFTDPTLAIETDGLVTADAELTFQVTPGTQITVGARNVLDTYPDKHRWAHTYGFLGADYPLTHPAGFDGGSYYLKVVMDI